MIIYVDIDGTICTLNSSDDENKDQSFDPAGYEDAQPIEENIDKINKLYDWIELTRQQLFEWGCKCHDVRVGKPQYDLWIDDKSMRIEEV